MAGWLAFQLGPGRRDEGEFSVGVASNFPVVFVDVLMVLVAQETAIARCCFSAVGPVLNVVAIGPAGWGGTGWEPTSTVTLHEDFAGRSGERSLFTADIDDFGSAVGKIRASARRCVEVLRACSSDDS